jgi:hypothetical protein
MEILAELTKSNFLHRRMLYLETFYPENGCTCLKLADQPLLAIEIFLIQYIHRHYHVIQI